MCNIMKYDILYSNIKNQKLSDTSISDSIINWGSVEIARVAFHKKKL